MCLSRREEGVGSRILELVSGGGGQACGGGGCSFCSILSGRPLGVQGFLDRSEVNFNSKIGGIARAGTGVCYTEQLSSYAQYFMGWWGVEAVGVVLVG